MNILDQIMAAKRSEVTRRKSEMPVASLEASPAFSRPMFSVRHFVKDPGKTGIIAEFKRCSPSKGIINDVSDVVEVTSAYAKLGASCLSVLTDEAFFGGSTQDLLQARVNEIPILRKDFMVDEYQLIEAKAMGADVILLIAACLTVKETKRLAVFARNLGLEVLLELHGKEEIDHVCDEADLVGINNRNLKTFEVNWQHSIDLAASLPADKIKIAESGIHSVDTLLMLKDNGFDGFLIGENFMKHHDPAIAFASFVNELKEKTA